MNRLPPLEPFLGDQSSRLLHVSALWDHTSQALLSHSASHHLMTRIDKTNSQDASPPNTGSEFLGQAANFEPDS